MSTLPDYFNPSHFRVGQPVMYGEFCGTVSCYYGDGMWDVRLPGGPACVSGSDIKDAEANQQQESDMGTARRLATVRNAEGVEFTALVK